MSFTGTQTTTNERWGYTNTTSNATTTSYYNTEPTTFIIKMPKFVKNFEEELLKEREMRRRKDMFNIARSFFLIHDFIPQLGV